MADLLDTAKSIRVQSGDEAADSYLTAVTSTSTKSKSSVVDVSQPKQKRSNDASTFRRTVESPEEVLQTLRSQPDVELLVAALGQLNNAKIPYAGSETGFNLHTPGPIQAQIIHILLNTIVPDFWPVLDESQRNALVSCLRNVAGFNAVVARLRLRTPQSGSKVNQIAQGIGDLINVTQRLFSGDVIVFDVWLALQVAVSESVKRDMSWKEFVNLLSSGKIIAAVAQAEDAVGSKQKGCWLAKGAEYASWLGTNIASLALNGASPPENTNAAAQVLTKALNLGYPEHLLRAVFERLIRAEDHQSGTTVSLLTQIPAHAKRSLTEHSLRWLSTLASNTAGGETAQQKRDVSAIAGFIATATQDDVVNDHFLSFLKNPGLLASVSLAIYRACLAALSERNDDDIQSLLDKTMSTFSNTLFINHSPILQQESIAQTLLLAAGYVHRQTPMALLMIARSSNHMQGVSNRLDSSNPRARWLGMIVGTAISSLVDKEGSKMTFGTEEIDTEEARWYLSLVNLQDKLGTLQDFSRLLKDNGPTKKLIQTSLRQRKNAETMPKLNGKPVFGPPRPPAQTEVVGDKVTEILEDDSEDENELKPYAKPDSDPEDSDEDATLVNRKKIRPPVYIRDLMSMLRDDKSHDRFQLAIKHAAGLIRRKTNFGSEVKDHAEELAVILCNLQDPFETDDFDELKLQALIAVLLSDVKSLPPWLCRQAFSGDYSVAQRCIILSALGLGGRELAGLKSEDELNPAIANTEFPSKRLPEHLASTYSGLTSSTKRLEAASKDMEHSLIKPLALQAADQSTAHLNAVKVRTFSSRMDVQRTKRRPVPNQLAKIFGEAFFFPLANRYQQDVAAYGSASVFSSVPFVLVTFLKTLALLLHASGSATLGLSQVSVELWELLLSLRVQAVSDISVLQVVLFALLTVLEVNEDKKRIAEECPKQLMETQRWVDLVFERTGGGGLVSEDGNEDEVKVRTLAAGVLVKVKEIIDAYQKQLMGLGFE